MKTYSLSVEELSMCLAMINRPDLGQMILRAFYDDLTKDQVDSRMTAASHSLLARGVCGLTADGHPRLEDDLERTLFPIAKYDFVCQFSLVKGERAVNSTIHVQKGKAFTSHNIQAGVVHLLEYGAWKEFVPFLMDILEADSKVEKWTIPAGQTISVETLGKALECSSNQRDLQNLFAPLLWHETAQAAIIEDFLHQVSRATLIRVDAKSGASDRDIASAQKKTLLLLKGKSRTWCFNFPSPDPQATCQAQIISHQELFDILSAFVA